MRKPRKSSKTNRKPKYNEAGDHRIASVGNDLWQFQKQQERSSLTDTRIHDGWEKLGPYELIDAAVERLQRTNPPKVG